MRIDLLPPRRPATIATVDWASLDAGAARRLRELGVDEGVRVELLHEAPLSRDPIALRVGRMTIAIRRAQAHAITVELEQE